jgi:hypothetical protein
MLVKGNKLLADVAQLVEPRFVVPVVVSSSLIVRPNKEAAARRFFYWEKRKDRRELGRAEDKNISGGNIFTAKQRNILTSEESDSDRGEIRCRWNELLKTAQPHRPPQ